jgi:hypothetical protein
MALLLRDEARHRLQEIRIADFVRVTLRRLEQMGAVRRFAELPAGQRTGNLRQLARCDRDPLLPGNRPLVLAVGAKVLAPLGGGAHGGLVGIIAWARRGFVDRSGEP